MKKNISFFPTLGVFGFDAVETIIVAALVSEDPILLIGRSGTGKTFLLNSISEAMHLEHRHYNASLISFDDLIGFPYPATDGKSIDFLPTPATIWNAESVLVDELSRCKPEIQNKFFSIIYERKIQGISLSKLRFRWAAMNPFGFEGNEDDQYDGSEPLDQALADRFAFIVEVPDWNELSTDDQESVIFPAGEGAIADDKAQLKNFVDKIKIDFLNKINDPSKEVITYARYASTMMTEAGYRISPRRARLLARNMIALECVEKERQGLLNIDMRKDLYKLALTWSMPHRAWKGMIPAHIIDSVHAEVVRLVFKANKEERWLAEFLQQASLPNKVSMLFDKQIHGDVKSLAVMQFFRGENDWQSAIFSFTTFPLVNEMKILNNEANNELAKMAKPVYRIQGELEWKERLSESDTTYPGWAACQKVINNLPKTEVGRKNRAIQLFLHLLIRDVGIPDPVFIESELQNTFLRCKQIKEDVA